MTTGKGARGFNLYDGSLEQARFQSITTEGDGSVGIQVSKPLGTLTVTGDVTTSGGEGLSLVKGVQVVLKAIALSVKATGTVDSITIGGKLVTSGSNVATLEVEGTVDSFTVAGGVHATGSRVRCRPPGQRPDRPRWCHPVCPVRSRDRQPVLTPGRATRTATLHFNYYCRRLGCGPAGHAPHRSRTGGTHGRRIRAPVRPAPARGDATRRAAAPWTPADGRAARASTSATAPRRCSRTRRGCASCSSGRRSLPKPKAILIVSAHWESAPLAVSATAADTPLVYDFGGFDPHVLPDAVRHPGRRRARARQVAALMPDAEPVHEHPSRGLDHGAWVPLKVMYPTADIPVAPAEPADAGPGAAARPRPPAATAAGAGRAHHRLRLHDPRTAVPAPRALLRHGCRPDWSRDFDAWAADALARGDVDRARRLPRCAPGMPYAHPTVEHYIPLFVTLGAATEPGCPGADRDHGYGMGLSKRSVQVA